MGKPWYQKLVEKSGWILAGIIGLSSLLDGISNATALINFPIASTATILVFHAGVMLRYLFPKKKIKWVINGQQSNIISLGPGLKLPIIGALLLLWFGAISNHTVSEKNVHINEKEIIRPLS